MKILPMNLISHDYTVLNNKIWLPDNTPRAIVFILHGMTEHMGRYERLAAVLTSHDYIVCGFDLRGHGRNPGDMLCASMGVSGWEDSLKDIHCFYSALTSRFPGIPRIMLGFSLGSFLLRDYIGRYREKPDGVLLLGTGDQPGFVLKLLKCIVKGQIKEYGFDNETALVNKLSFEMYNKKFKPVRTYCDWLCSDSGERELYMTDSLCRKNISAGLFWQLLDSMERTGRSASYRTWNKDIPIFLLSGADDPVGDCGRGIRRIYKSMKKSGFTHVRMQLVKSARHDLLHEPGPSGNYEGIRLVEQFLTELLS